MFTHESLQTLQKQQELLKFDLFSHKDALAIGQIMLENTKELDRPVAIKVIYDGCCVFSYFQEGTNERNNWWLNRKLHTVDKTHEPSLKARIEKELGLKDEFWMQNEDYYALAGGAFPIYVGDVMYGVAMVSGLPHVEDHNFVVKALAQYKNIEVEKIFCTK